MKMSLSLVASVVVLFLSVSNTAAFRLSGLPTATVDSLVVFFFAAEPVGGAMLYVDNPADFIITTDQGAPGLDNGDTVAWNPSGGSHGTVSGLTFGANAFGTIQSAVNAAAAGDTVNVAHGTFSELVTVNKQLFLRGNQFGVDGRAPARTGLPATETVVNGNDLGSGIHTTAFYVTASNVTLDGFTVQDSRSSVQFGTGIRLSAGISGSEVRNNIVQNNISGLHLANGAGEQAVIERNLFRNNNEVGPASGTAIYTDQFVGGGAVTNVAISNNTFSNNVNAAVLFGSTLAGSQSNITISNNKMDANGNAVFVLNLLNSSVIGNTITGSIGSQIVIGGGVNGLAVRENVIHNGLSRGIRVGDFGGGAPNQNVGANRNSITGNVGAGLEALTGGYTGILHATLNWWSSVTGPTTPSNPGGTGQTISDPSGVVDFQPWLLYGDADPIATGLQIPSTFTVEHQTGIFTTTNNNYRRLVNAVESLQPGQSLILAGIFDWTEANAAASWALGNDGVVGSDDYALVIRPNLNNVTISAESLGAARIQGPGDVPSRNLESVFTFAGGDHQDWTISNLEIFDFDASIFMLSGSGGADAYNGTRIVNNRIRIATDLNNVVAPNDNSQNIGIHYSFGTNQTISGNQIDIPGDGISDPSAHPTLNRGAFATSVAMQCNIGGGAVYDGLQITANTIRVLNAQNLTLPERIIGIWELSTGHTSDIIVSQNQFLNLAAGNNPSVNRQQAFWVTSHSGPGTTVTYSENTVDGANIGFKWLGDPEFPGMNFAGNQPIILSGNTLTNVETGFLIQSNGAATFTDINNVTGTGSATSVGVDVRQGARVSVLGGSFTNNGVGINVDGTLRNGVSAAALIQGADLNSNSVAGLRLQNGAQVDAGGGGYTGLGTSIGGNDFSEYSPVGPGRAIQNFNADAGFTGTFVAAPPDMRARNNIFASASAAFVEQVIDHDVDVPTRGFVDFAGSQGGNLAPVAVDDSYSTNEDTPLSGSSVLANDTDADNDTLTAVLVSGPANAQSFTLNANGTFSYTPSTNFNGTDSFTYKANDGFHDSNVATVSITVTAVNDAPTVAVVRGGSCAAGDDGGTMNLLVSDVESSAASLTLGGVSSNTTVVPPANVTFGGSGSNRTVSITAVPQRSTQSSVVTITVNDGDGGSSTVAITVFAGTSRMDIINGTGGADLILGLNGDDTINAGTGNDLVCGGKGSGTVDGGDGDDTIDGGNGNDVVRGGAGHDLLIGGQGNDRLEGGDDDDTLTGGNGADVFSGGSGTDVATDFTPGQGDTSDGTIP